MREGNPLVKVHKSLKDRSVYALSAERGNKTSKENKEAGKSLKRKVDHFSKNRKIELIRKGADGEYRYADPRPGEEGTSHEKSVVFTAAKGEGEEGTSKFKRTRRRNNREARRIATKLGKDYDQESILKMRKGKNEKRASGSLINTKGSDKGHTEKIGSAYYNPKEKLKTGTGATHLKGRKKSGGTVVVK